MGLIRRRLDANLFTIVNKLAPVGGSSGHVARKFKLSPSRISKLRKQLRRSWKRFEDEDAATDGAVVATA